MDLPDWLDYVQWPAMAVTIAATYLVGSKGATQHKIGFWLFLLSNVLWIAWGLYAAAWALLLLQVALGMMNVRGAKESKEVEQERA